MDCLKEMASGIAQSKVCLETWRICILVSFLYLLVMTLASIRMATTVATNALLERKGISLSPPDLLIC